MATTLYQRIMLGSIYYGDPDLTFQGRTEQSLIRRGLIVTDGKMAYKLTDSGLNLCRSIFDPAISETSAPDSQGVK